MLTPTSTAELTTSTTGGMAPTPGGPTSTPGANIMTPVANPDARATPTSDQAEKKRKAAQVETALSLPHDATTQDALRGAEPATPPVAKKSRKAGTTPTQSNDETAEETKQQEDDTDGETKEQEDETEDETKQQEDDREDLQARRMLFAPVVQPSEAHGASPSAAAAAAAARPPPIDIAADNERLVTMHHYLDIIRDVGSRASADGAAIELALDVFIDVEAREVFANDVHGASLAVGALLWVMHRMGSSETVNGITAAAAASHPELFDCDGVVLLVEKALLLVLDTVPFEQPTPTTDKCVVQLGLLLGISEAYHGAAKRFARNAKILGVPGTLLELAGAAFCQLGFMTRLTLTATSIATLTAKTQSKLSAEALEVTLREMSRRNTINFRISSMLP